MHAKRKRSFVPAHLFSLSVAAVLLALPAVAASQSTKNLEQRVAKMERMLDSGTLLKLLQSVEELKNEVRELRGQLEQQQNSLSQVTDRQRELYLDVDRRLQRMAAGGVAAGVAPGSDTASGPGTAPSSAPALSTAGASSTATSGTATVAAAGAATQSSTAQAATPGVDPVKEQKAYQSAFNLLKAGRYDQAAKSFQKFLGAYPDGKYSDNAQYWLGESYYVTRNFDSALREFDKLVTQHPDSQKVTHALLKIGYIHDELGQKDKAREVLTDLTKNYPRSTAAGLAAKRLERMGSQ